jgi:hypothetical protein
VPHDDLRVKKGQATKYLFLVALGGAIGSAARYLVGAFVGNYFGPDFPSASPMRNDLLNTARRTHIEERKGINDTQSPRKAPKIEIIEQGSANCWCRNKAVCPKMRE